MTNAAVSQLTIFLITTTISTACSWIAAIRTPSKMAPSILVGALSAFLAFVGTITAFVLVDPPPLQKLSPIEFLLVFTVIYGIPASLVGAVIGATVHRLIWKRGPTKGGRHVADF